MKSSYIYDKFVSTTVLTHCTLYNILYTRYTDYLHCTYIHTAVVHPKLKVHCWQYRYLWDVLCAIHMNAHLGLGWTLG